MSRINPLFNLIGARNFKEKASINLAMTRNMIALETYVYNLEFALKLAKLKMPDEDAFAVDRPDVVLPERPTVFEKTTIDFLKDLDLSPDELDFKPAETEWVLGNADQINFIYQGFADDPDFIDTHRERIAEFYNKPLLNDLEFLALLWSYTKLG